MRQRSKAGGKPVKTRLRKESNASKAVRPRSSSAQEKIIARLTRECDAASEQLFAASEVLKSSAPRPGSWRRYFRQFWKMQLASARPSSVRYSASTARWSNLRQELAHRRNSPNSTSGPGRFK